MAMEDKELRQEQSEKEREEALFQEGASEGSEEGEAQREEVVLSKEEYEHLAEEARKAKELYEKCLRIQADYDNARKRLEREREEFIKFAQFRIIQDFLAVLDDFERAYESAKSSRDIEKLIEGLEMIGKDLYNLLKKYGVEEIEAEGKAFNPEVHEALMQEERDDVPENTVVAVLQKGYKLHDKVLRPARVKVSRRPEEKKADSGEIGSSEVNEN